MVSASRLASSSDCRARERSKRPHPRPSPTEPDLQSLRLGLCLCHRLSRARAAHILGSRPFLARIQRYTFPSTQESAGFSGRKRQVLEDASLGTDQGMSYTRGYKGRGLGVPLLSPREGFQGSPESLINVVLSFPSATSSAPPTTPSVSQLCPNPRLPRTLVTAQPTARTSFTLAVGHIIRPGE